MNKNKALSKEIVIVTDFWYCIRILDGQNHFTALPLCSGPARELIKLNAFIGSMACQKQVISRLYHPCKPHKESRIHTHCCIKT